MSVNHQASQILTRGAGVGGSDEVTEVTVDVPCISPSSIFQRTLVLFCGTVASTAIVLDNVKLTTAVLSSAPSQHSRFLDATALRHGLRAQGAQLRVAVAPWSQPHGAAAVGGSRGSSGPKEASGLAGLGAGCWQRHLENHKTC